MHKTSFVRSLLCAAALFIAGASFSQTLYDSFGDGNFTASPVWGGNTTDWTIVANSTAAAGATGSSTLRLNAPAVVATRYLSSQVASWGTSQEWGFWWGRSNTQEVSSANQMYFWLYANESNLTSGTVDGYRIAFGNNTTNDVLRLEYIVNGAVSSTVITTSAGTTAGINDFGFLVRVTRSTSGAWEIFTSALPTTSGSGAVASEVPNSTNAPTSRGTGTNNTLVPAANGYIGIGALHSTGASAIVAAEFDQIYFTPTGGAPTINGTITAGEYGNHTEGQNQATNAITTYMTWDATNLYVGIGPTSNNTNEPFVLYIDMDPIVPVNGGTNADGSWLGFNNYNRCVYNQPFRADFVLFWREGTSPYYEYRTDNGANGWGAQTTTGLTRAQSGSGANNGQEIAIPWSAITGAGMPASFNWHSHKIYDNSASDNGVYGELPAENPGGAQNQTTYFLQAVRYYTVSVTTIGSSTPPMSRNSYTHPFGVTDNNFGAISVWDFTMNSNSQQITRSGGGAWTISGTLVVNSGAVSFGASAPYGATTITNLLISGGSLSTGTTTVPTDITTSVVLTGGTFFAGGTVNDLIRVQGNWSGNGGSFSGGIGQVEFNGTTLQTIGGSSSNGFYNLTINNPANVQLGSAMGITNVLTLTSGRLQLGAFDLTDSGPIGGGSASSYVQTNANGRWVRPSLSAGGQFFPIGNSSYNPITITNTGTTDTHSVRVVDGTVPNTLNNKTVNRYWDIRESTAGGSVLSVVPQWNTGEESAGFTAGTLPFIGFWNGSSWTQQSATQSGSNPFTFSSAGTFAPADMTSGTQYFANGKDDAFVPLPDIVVSPTSIAFGFTASGGTSAQQSFTVTGTNLSPASGNITITPPANFEISTTNGGPYSASAITLPYTGGALATTTIYIVFKPTGPPSSYSANITAGGGGATTENVAVTGNSLPLAYQSFDTFNRSNSAVVGIPSSGGAASWTEIETGGSCSPTNNIIRINNNQLELSNCNQGNTGSCGGTTYKAAMFDMTGKYATTYSQAGGVLEWYFNMKQSRTSPSGLSGTTYGTAFILGCNESNPGTATADGYMVSFGDGGGADPIRLVYFTNGMPAPDTPTMDGITVCSAASPGTKTNYMSIKVTFDPCTNLWSLYVRDDGSTAFNDPTNISVSPSTGTNSTYVNTALIYSGAFWRHSSSCEEIAIYDNISIPNNAAVSTTYVWDGSVSTDYQVADNWTPSRTCPRPNDILVWNAAISPATSDVTNVPTQTVAQVLISGNRTVTFRDVAGDVAASTLSIQGTTGTDLSVESGSLLVLDAASSNNASDAVVINVLTGATGLLDGDLHMQNSNAGTAGRNHRLLAADASAILINGDVNAFDLNGNPFENTGTANAIIFQSGSTFSSYDGANPFGLAQPASRVVFQTGSTYYHRQTTFDPSLFGRVYSNFVMDVTGTVTMEFGSTAVWTADNVSVVSGTFELTGLSNTAAVSADIKGNLSVSPGASLLWNPNVASTLRFFGTAQQVISGSGTITLGSNLTVDIDNSFGASPQVRMDRNLTINGPLILTEGTFGLNTNQLDFAGPTISRNGTSQIGLIDASPSLSEVRLIQSGALTIPSGVFSSTVYELTLDGGDVTINGNVQVSNIFNLANTGNLYTGSNILTLGTSGTQPGSLNWLAPRRIIGNFRRWIPASQGAYYFPMGTASTLNDIMAFLYSPVAGTLTASFVNTNPGAAGLPLLDVSYSADSQLTYGYWGLTAANGFSCASYDLELNGNGFTGINSDTRVIKRPDGGGNWTLNGTHQSALGNTARRQGLTGFSEFGLAAAAPCPIMVNNPGVLTQTLCEGETTSALNVSVIGGSGSFSYQWFSNLTNTTSGGTNLGSGNGAQTPSYTPPNTPSGTLYYYCEVIQTGSACGTFVHANASEVIIHARPTASLSGDVGICAGGNTTLSIAVTGSGTISGTLNPGAIPFSGTAPTITVNVSPSISTIYTVASLSDANCTALAGDLTGTRWVRVLNRIPVACETTTTITLGGAGDAVMTSCAGGSLNDVVLEFTPTITGVHNLEVVATNGDAVLYQLVDATANGYSCSSFPALLNGSCIAATSSPTSISLGVLTAGTTYWILAEDNVITSAQHDVRIDCPFDCSSITSISCETPVSPVLTGDDDLNAPFCLNSGFAEQVYSFQATETGVHNLVVDATNGNILTYILLDLGTGTWDCASALSGGNPATISGATQLACIYQSVTGIAGSYNLTAGNNYLLVVETNLAFPGLHTFHIDCPFDCSSVTTIACETPVTPSLSGDDDINAPFCLNTGFAEQVYSFQATTNGVHNLVVDASNGNILAYILLDLGTSPWNCATEVTVANPVMLSGYTQLACIYQSATGLAGSFNLTAGNYYLLVVENNLAFPAVHTFHIDCPYDCSAVTSLACDTPVTPTFSGDDDVSASFCLNGGFIDRLYSFTATTTGPHSLVVDASNGNTLAYSFFDLGPSTWNCAGAVSASNPAMITETQLACIYQNAVGTAGTFNLTAGNNYLLLVEQQTSFPGVHTFRITCPCTASVSIAASPSGPICAGTAVTFTPTPVNGGTPSYQWYINGTPAGTGSTLVSSSLLNTDQVTVEMNSSLSCATPDPSTSNTITMTVNSRPTASVSGSTTICNGGSTTVSISVTGSGTISGILNPGAIPFSGTAPTINVNVSPSVSSVYAVTSLSDANCTALAGDLTGTYTVNVNARPTGVLSGDQTICAAGPAGTLTINVTGTGPFSGTLNPGAVPFSGAGPVISVNVLPGSSTTYTLATLNDANCSALAGDMSGSASVTVTPASTYYLDGDGDGWSNGSSVLACTAPPNYYLAAELAGLTDCNDANADINPGADEWCNGVDDNCAGGIDEGLITQLYYQDSDGDGFGNNSVSQLACTAPAGYVLNNTDCSDTNAQRYPGAPELCNGVDDDCDGITDEGCGPINDARENALVVYPGTFTNCQPVNGTLIGATVSPEAGTTVITGEDTWHYFLAQEPAVRIECTAASANILIELQTDTGTLLNVEDVQAVPGNEILNFYGLTPNSTYYIRVRNYNSAQGTGTYTLCVKSVENSGCDYGPGPYTLCQVFKATNTGANNYTFNFTPQPSGTTVSVTPPSFLTTLQIQTIPNVAYNTTYNVTVDATYVLTNGAGGNETLVVPGTPGCTMIVGPHPDPDLRASDAAPNTRNLNSIIGAQLWVCGATEYVFEFTQTAPSPGLPFTVENNAPSRFLNLYGVPGIVAGGVYDVRIAPKFGAVTGSFGGDIQVLQIAAAAPMPVYDGGGEWLQPDERTFETDGQYAVVYPNPLSGGEFFVRLNQQEEERWTVEVRDLSGRLIQTEVTADGEMLRVGLPADIAGGVYTVNLLSDISNLSYRLVIQR